ncbi:hypothetical protein NEOCIP111885_00673 [Pseudoneobacillus rhizosphaerae]|uniref:Uncharacterized protein n=1 Tax=Pseudoneobacillus rhizosphaerae TaxID=2880968 RepID=A0A9C7G7A7_9BACI|nr:hypothetical protein NEOCIP111885_00673 [Pseudoneobacillus rhizosphaerae]
MGFNRDGCTSLVIRYFLVPDSKKTLSLEVQVRRGLLYVLYQVKEYEFVRYGKIFMYYFKRIGVDRIEF